MGGIYLGELPVDPSRRRFGLHTRCKFVSLSFFVPNHVLRSVTRVSVDDRVPGNRFRGRSRVFSVTSYHGCLS